MSAKSEFFNWTYDSEASATSEVEPGNPLRLDGSFDPKKQNIKAAWVLAPKNRNGCDAILFVELSPEIRQ